MKCGILGYYHHFGEPNDINIGDYIQSLAQAMFLGKIDCFVPRENIKNFKAKEKILMILNGWFKDYPLDWPPSPCIEPLFVSFHIFPRNAELIFSQDSLEYFRRNAPIGCRDKNTEKILKDKKIESYFSGCLTLTLGEKYKTQDKTDKVYFVDVLSRRQKFFKILTSIVKNFFKIMKILEIWKKQNFNQEYNMLKIFIKANNFYEQYSEHFSDEILFNAEYVCHTVHPEMFKNEQEKLDYAENLVRKYACAKLVVTSRIHCALPCVGLETPVIFVTDENGDIGAEGRLDGLIDLFDKIAYATRDGLVFKERKKTDYVPLKNALVKQVKKFIRQKEIQNV